MPIDISYAISLAEVIRKDADVSGSLLSYIELITVYPLLFSVNVLAGGVLIFLATLIITLALLLKSRNKYRKAQETISALKQENASKDKFFSIVAHDLKSPFNSLIGLSEMLMLNSDSMNGEQIQKYSKMLHQSTSRLYTLVDNLLQWSRTQMGTTDYRPVKLDINITTDNIVNLLRLSAQEKDIVISVRLEEELIAMADANIYSAVLRNIINNAIKFSRVGSVIQVNGHQRNDRMIEIEVIDRGVGMDSKQLENVFRLDTNDSTIGTFNEKGSGLGLILCKEFTEINRGSIEINSKSGQGTSVRFTVPSVSYHLN